MSMLGPIEATSLAVGDELNDLAGLRSTRLTAQLNPEQQLDSDVGTATGTVGTQPAPVTGNWTWDGTTTILSDDTSSVVVTDFIRLDSDGQVFEITSIVPNVSVTVLNPGALTIPNTGGSPGATSFLTPTVVTRSSGTWPVTVVPGTRYRILEGALEGVSALINTVDSPTVITLRLGLAAHASVNWEVAQDADSVAQVESTLNWEASGRVRIDGILYKYSSKTLTSLSGLEGFDDVDFIRGVLQEHRTSSEVLDVTGVYNELDKLRREVLVEYSAGKLLNVLGRNISVNRPTGLSDDDDFRALIKAVAYAPRGTIYSLEQALDALVGETQLASGTESANGSGDPAVITLTEGEFPVTVVKGTRFRLTDVRGEPDLDGITVLVESRDSSTQITLQAKLGTYADGNPISVTGASWEVTEKDWEIFEDLTSGSPVNNPGTVYFRTIISDEEEFNGKTFIEDPEEVPTTGATTAVLGASPIRVGGMQLAEEPRQRLIHTGRAAITGAGLTATRTDGGFGDRLSPNSFGAVTSVSAGLFSTLIVSTGAFEAGDVGKVVNLRGMANAVNNGDFLITAFTSATEVTVANPFTMVVEGAGGGWIITRIKIGDIFQITDGIFANEQATILDISTDGQVLTLSPTQADLNHGLWFIDFSSAVGAAAPGDVTYQIYRPFSNFRFVRPTDERYLDESGSPVTQWTYGDTATAEASESVFVVDHPSFGNYLSILDPGAADTAEFTRPLRVFPESKASFEFHFSVAGQASGASDYLQFAFELHDGERNICVGVRDIGGTTAEVAFVDANGGSGGTKIGTGEGEIDSAGVAWKTFKIVKDGRNQVRLEEDGHVVAVADYTDFDTSTSRELRWGVLEGNIGPGGGIKSLDWQVNALTELWNAHFSNVDTTAPNQIDDIDALGLFTGADVGKRVRLKDFTTLNAGLGHAALEWEIVTAPTGDQITVIGPTFGGGNFTSLSLQVLQVRGKEDAFLWPDHRGHSVEILDGPNAGIFPIVDILNPANLQDVEEKPINDNDAGSLALEILSTDPSDGLSAPVRVEIFGLVGGTRTKITVAVLDNKVPNVITTAFDAASVDQMSFALAAPGPSPEPIPNPFNGTIILRNVADESTVLQILPGEVNYGRPQMLLQNNGAVLGGVADITTRFKSSAVLLDTVGGAPSLPQFQDVATETRWRIVPAFPADTGLPMELVDAGSVAVATLTTRQDINTLFGMSTGELVQVKRSSVLSGQVSDERDAITETSSGPPRVLSHYAFWLADDFGLVRTFLDILTAAGVIADFDNFFRDDTGPHIKG